MYILFLTIISLVVFVGLCTLRVSNWIWLAALTLGAASWQFSNIIPKEYTLLFWGIVGFIDIFFLLPSIRRMWFSKLILCWFKKILPPMSDTEREAIDSGDTWIESNLFQGKPDWQGLLALPKPKLTGAEQNFIDNQVSTLCSMLDDWDITHKRLDLSKNTWAYLKQEKFFALHIPKEYGGLGFSALANSTIVQKVSTRSLTAAVTIMVPNSLGPGELLLNYGTREQKHRYLPGLARGEEIPCFALTGVEAGSDATAMQDTGIICKGNFDGKEIIGVSLNWNKRYITLAPVSTLLGLAVKLYDPENLLDEKYKSNKSKDVDAKLEEKEQNDLSEYLGITVFLLPTSLSGVEVGKRHFPLNQSFMNGPIKGHDVFVPLDFIVGGPAMVGQGWRMLVECLSAGRGISLPALSTASGKLSYRMTGAYAAIRRQFGVAIGKFEGVEAALARIGGYTYMLEATRLLTLTAIDQGLQPAIVTAISKYHMTEMGRQVINDAMDIHGGKGIIMGKRNYLARAYQGIPISITVEGANILTRSLIIFGQGAIRCHPYVKSEIEIASQDISPATVEAFDRILMNHISYTVSNFAKWILHALTGFYFSKRNKKLGKFQRHFNKMSLALACISDITMLILGGELKRKEHLSARLGDVLSHLYIGSAVIKYYHDHDKQNTDLPFIKWSLMTCLYDMQTAMLQFLQNFPNKFLAKGLKLLLFPFGPRYQPPSDKLGNSVVKHMLTGSSFRDRITNDCYFKEIESDPIGKLELALVSLMKAKPILDEIDKAIKQKSIPKSADFNLRLELALSLKIISEDEAKILKDYDIARIDVIEVDDFSTEELNGEYDYA